MLQIVIETTIYVDKKQVRLEEIFLNNPNNFKFTLFRSNVG